MNPNRRQFLHASVASMALAAASGNAFAKSGKSHPHVVVVGAGWGGATCAKYLRLWDPGIQVTLIEPNPHFISCPMSNWVVGGFQDFDYLVKSYDNLPRYGIQMLQDLVIGVDADKQVVRTRGGRRIRYDRLVLAPGMEWMTETVEGYEDGAKAQKVMHAFRAGPETLLLRKQLEAMPDGGVFIIASPPRPGRCVSGPYERACAAAHYFKQHKPKSKIIMLDGDIDIVSKGPMFKAAWKEFYPGMIEHRPNNLAMGFDHREMVVRTEFEDVKGDVVNIIPPQRAPRLCKDVGVRNDALDRWCGIDFVTYESTSVPKVHVIGDPVLSNMPKSAHVSNNQAKICAAALIEILNDRQPLPTPVIGSTSYSITSDHTSGSIAVVMRYDPAKKAYIRQPEGGANTRHSELDFAYGRAWHENMWADTLG
ncbi:MAG TPA: FAD-dependent oxidoreductase [Thiobacillaceae bacterium]|nr:FAD-dependent oxidoreductase [Thiobacillaceae bacterium]HNU63371.1 FAD-dependent oxidoreductase [Thiobacillaceae bacterium]